MKRIVFTMRRTAHVVVASVAIELALDFGAGALAVILAPHLGNWVYVVASMIVVGSLPVLSLLTERGREVGADADACVSSGARVF